MMFTPEHRNTLLSVALESIRLGVYEGRSLSVKPANYDESLQAVRSSFVTLELKGILRGCIGSLEATQPLISDVAQRAYAAAFSDPRFSPLEENELPDLAVKISVLFPRTPVHFDTSHDLLSRLRPGIDGVIIAQGHRSATFLPSVWHSLQDPKTFLKHLKDKAGIPADTDDFKAWRYTTENIPPD
jgi:AmmeMemoRadiSam system protein A